MSLEEERRCRDELMVSNNMLSCVSALLNLDQTKVHVKKTQHCMKIDWAWIKEYSVLSPENSTEISQLDGTSQQN